MFLEPEGNRRCVRINGAKLGKSLDRNPNNSIGRPTRDFRDRTTQLMADECGLACDQEDVIANGGGGYHCADWVMVRKPGEESEKPRDGEGHASDNALNDRQQQILARIESGARLQQKDVVAMFRQSRNASTIKRDLKTLRDMGLIGTHRDGYYVRTGV